MSRHVVTDHRTEPWIIPTPEPWIIPQREPAKPGRAVWISCETYAKLRAIKQRTGQSYAAILAMLVERAK